MKPGEPDKEPEADPDDWGSVIAFLCSKGLDPTRFGDLTYPMMMNILADGKGRRKADEAVRARGALDAFNSGQISW